jgi:hypothetical protein
MTRSARSVACRGELIGDAATPSRHTSSFPLSDPEQASQSHHDHDGANRPDTDRKLRPEEWIALERGDVDRDARLVHVRRRFTRGALKQGGKTDGSVRSVPLRQKVIDALDAMPPRIDTRLVFPAHRGGYIDLDTFRTREWTPTLRAAGIDHRSIYTMRHTFATWAIESGLQLSYIATVMGTSVRELEDTYFRWLRRTDERLLNVFDSYDARTFGPHVGHETVATAYADERT